jgi:mRNA-degrading endonuclease RelE of RelBE toxin-antitoxin system
MSKSERIEVSYSAPFLKRLKGLAKRYRHIQQDIQPIIETLQSGNFLGDQIPGTGYAVFKVRAQNSDIPTGKSGGYRIIYQVLLPQMVLMLLIYAKTEQTDVNVEEITEAIKKGES